MGATAAHAPLCTHPPPAHALPTRRPVRFPGPTAVDERSTVDSSGHGTNLTGQRCTRHGLPLPCDCCGQETWREMLRLRLPSWPETATAAPRTVLPDDGTP